MIILDTNVLSELMKPRPNPDVAQWITEQPRRELFTTAVTKAEMLYGVELLSAGKRKDALLAEVEKMFTADLGERVLAFESDSALPFATIAAERRAKGRPISDLDAQIAAVARTHKATLATRNLSDFEDCGIEVINPWRAER
jgi:hypothetical protein